MLEGKKYTIKKKFEETGEALESDLGTAEVAPAEPDS